MGMFDNMNWSDPATQAQLNYSASLMQGKQGLFPAMGAALQSAQQGAQFADQQKARDINLADGLRQLQVWKAGVNEERRKRGMPDLTIKDLMAGKYKLLPDASSVPVGGPQPPMAAADQSSMAPPIAGLFGSSPQDTISGIQTAESGGNPLAVSPKGATGPMQLMPDTAANPGFGVEPAADASPEENKRVGADYFKALEQHYGNPVHALVAYNWGPGNTDKWLASGGDFSKLPDETKKYLGSVAVASQGQPQVPEAQSAPPVAGATSAPPVAPPVAGSSAFQIPSDLGLYNPDAALKIAMSQERTLSPQEAQTAGFPEGSVVQQDAMGGYHVASKPDWMSQKAYDQAVGMAQAKAAIGRNYQKAGPLYDTQGNYLGEGRFDPSNGQFEVQDGKGGWKNAPVDAQPEAPIKFDGPTLDYVATAYALSGKMPPMGRGKAAAQNRALVLKRSAELTNKWGLTPMDAVSMQAGVKANSQALAKMASYATMVKGFEDTANKGADLVLQLAPKGAGPSGSPILNRWIQYGRKSIKGDPDVAAFNNAIGTLTSEYAKIMSGSTGAQGASDASRKEAEDRIDKAYNVEQLKAVVDTMRQEMAFRMQALASQQQAIRQNIGGIVGAENQTPFGSTAKQASPASNDGWGSVQVHSQ